MTNDLWLSGGLIGTSPGWEFPLAYLRRWSQLSMNMEGDELQHNWWRGSSGENVELRIYLKVLSDGPHELAFEKSLKRKRFVEMNYLINEARFTILKDDAQGAAAAEADWQMVWADLQGRFD